MNEKREIHNGDRQSAMNELRNFIEACPQIIKPGIGLEAFVEDLNRAAIKYAKYTYVERPNKVGTEELKSLKITH